VNLLESFFSSRYCKFFSAIEVTCPKSLSNTCPD
jgi:hypothetical protein